MVLNTAHGVVSRDIKVLTRLQIHLDSLSNGTAICMSEDNYQLEGCRKMAHCVVQTSKTFLAQHIARNPHHEKLIGALAEQQFRRDASISTSQDGRKRSLQGRDSIAVTQAHP